MIGQVVGSYRIVAELGKGGMGVVYRAEHTQLGRPAALKMLLPALSAQPAIVQRFFNEAKAASAIDHPGIVEIYDYGTHTDGSAYIVMALLSGESLEDRLKRAPMSPSEAANVIGQVSAALAAAHAKGIVHRDLKPDNIFLTPNDVIPGGIQVKLLDFGIAKLADEQAAGLKTQTGALMGTPAYMSPEQCMGKSDIDHRTDLYSVGCILFHILCGRPPFLSDEGTGMMIAAQIRDAPPPPKSLNPHMPDALEAIVLRLLEKDPAARYQTAAELRAALKTASTAVPATYPPPQSQQAAVVPQGQSRTDPNAFAATAAPGSMPPVSQPPGQMVFNTPQPPAHTAQPSQTPQPTTHSGAAAEVMATSVGPRTKGKTGLMVALGAVLLVGAAGGTYFVLNATKGDGDKSADNKTKQPETPAGDATIDAGATTKAIVTKTTTAKTAATAEADAKGAPAEPKPECPEGQSRRPDTHGNCCWEEQAWSLSKKRCVGTPVCPPGTEAKGETCVKEAKKVASKSRRPPEPPPRTKTPVRRGSKLRFSLAKKRYAPRERIIVKFNRPVPSSGRNRAWVTVVGASRPASSYGAWTYVSNHARAALLKAPRKPGRYEVRLHTNYPAKRYNVVYVVGLTVGAAATTRTTAPASLETPRHLQRFSLSRRRVAPRAMISIGFAVPLQAKKGERFWVTIVPVGTPASRYGAWKYVGRGARSMRLRTPGKPGSYEVRLHANYPRKSTNMVYRQRFTVQ